MVAGTHPKEVTFRTTLQSDVQDFLTEQGIECIATTRSVIELIIELAHYEEEGRPLYPQVLVCDECTNALRILNGLDPQILGEGRKEARTALLALKKCAPITESSWAMLIERRDETFKYGVFRHRSSPTSLSLVNTIRALPPEISGLFVMRQIARRCVELVGVDNRRLVVYVSAVQLDDKPRDNALDQMLDALTRDAGDDQESLKAFLGAQLHQALVEGHGALIAIVQRDTAIPDALVGDGIILTTPIELLPYIQACREHSQPGLAIAAASALQDYSGLLRGMLSSDGITLLRSDGAILGFNVFVRTLDEPGSSPSQLLGGARRRAYKALCSILDRGELASVFIRSSDGSSECRIGGSK